MKKIALLLLAGLSFTFAQAQVQYGLKAGVNYSNLSGDLQHEDIYQNKLGFVGGITTNIPLSSDGFFNLAPELLYSAKGYQYQDDKFTGPDGQEWKRKGDLSFNYIDLPVMFKINAGGLFFEAGPVASYLLDIKDKTELKIGEVDQEDTRIISKGNASDFEIGYAAGLGFKAPMGVTLNLRYNGSINALADENDGGDLTNGRHSLFQFTVGYLLGGNAQ
jgi:hypothetical protein